jgi:hypothetical protein
MGPNRFSLLNRPHLGNGGRFRSENRTARWSGVGLKIESFQILQPQPALAEHAQGAHE